MRARTTLLGVGAASALLFATLLASEHYVFVHEPLWVLRICVVTLKFAAPIGLAAGFFGYARVSGSRLAVAAAMSLLACSTFQLAVALHPPCGDFWFEFGASGESAVAVTFAQVTACLRLSGARFGLVAVAMILTGSTAFGTTPMRSGIGRLVRLSTLLAAVPPALFALECTPLQSWLPRTPQQIQSATPFVLSASAFGLAGKFVDLAIAEGRRRRRPEGQLVRRGP
jgi:hypothetical protein